MKKYIIPVIFITLLGAALYSIFTDKSYDYYEKAKVLYEQGKYREAYEILDQGLKKNNLNRKIIDLKGKIYPIMEGQQNLAEAEKLYQESINLALEGKVDDAKLNMSKAYDLAYKVSSASGLRDQAKELIRKIERDATLVLDSAQETRYKNALKQEAEGNLLRAYEALSNIDVKNEKVNRKMSDLAYRIGEQRYREISGQTLPNEHIVRDAVYWFSQVQPFDDNYMAANQRINELKLMKTK